MTLPAKIIRAVAPVLAALALTVAPVAPAGAWDQICVKLPLWKTWFAARFVIPYGFRPEINPRTNIVSQKKHSTRVLNANESQCVDITNIQPGELFYVKVFPLEGKGIVCDTHPSNPKDYYAQTGDRPYTTLHYEAWGTSLHPRCKFIRESN